MVDTSNDLWRKNFGPAQFASQADYEQVMSAIEKIVEDAKKIEMKYRKVLWLSHGHSGLYGDDGEMQCGRCRPWDYKRAPIEELEKAVFEAELEQMHEEKS